MQDYLVGPALDEAERSGEELEISWPLQVGSSRSNSIGTTASTSAEQNDEDMQVESNGSSAVQAKTKAIRREPDGVTDWIGLEALLYVWLP